MFTDGYADQIGGEKNHKLMLKRFRDLCERVGSLPISQQEAAFATYLADWMGSEPQVDDILLLGLMI
jgi:hypothetical protein